MIQQRFENGSAGLHLVGGEETGLHRWPWLLWGTEPARVHDRVWKARGVQIIRPGWRLEPSSRARAHLLLGSDGMLIDSDLGHVIKSLRRGGSVLLQLTDAMCVSDVYDESVERSDGGDHVRIKRHYHPPSNAIVQVIATRDAAAARAWGELDMDADLASFAAGWKVEPMDRSIPAIIGSAHEFDSSRRWLMKVASDRHAFEAAFPGVRRAGEQAWVHRDVAYTNETRFVGPVFVGAGAELPDDAVLVGPLLIPDREGVEPCATPEVVVREQRPLSAWWPVSSERTRWYRWTKRAFDIGFSLVGLVMTLPLLLIIAVLILIEDGRPIFYSAKRQTIFGREFGCLKFRSMVKNADAMQAKLREQDQNRSDGPQFHMDNDPRILKIGHIIRATQLDEIPQFINVLRGDMSVVGPRPSPDDENQCCPSWREARLSVRAGVTGLWQVCRQRGEHTDFQEWIKYDIEYVQHRSWGLDVWIIAKTITRMLPGFLGGGSHPVPPYARK